MKSILFLSVLTLAVAAVAVEPMPRTEAVKYAALANLDLEKLADTPIPTDGDVKRSYGMKAEEGGGLVVPEVKLSADTVAKATESVQPLGQLWLLGIVPMRGDDAVRKSDLKRVPVNHEGRETTVSLCVMGVRKGANGEPELLIYGKGKQPLITAALKKSTEKTTAPLEFTAEMQGDRAQVKLIVAGKYEATFDVTQEMD